MWWSGIGLFLGQLVITWGYFGIANSGPFGADEYNTMMVAYQYLSPVLWMMQMVGAILIAAGLVVRALSSRREVGVQR